LPPDERVMLGMVLAENCAGYAGRGTDGRWADEPTSDPIQRFLPE
jgi:hypothetical protein